MVFGEGVSRSTVTTAYGEVSFVVNALTGNWAAKRLRTSSCSRSGRHSRGNGRLQSGARRDQSSKRSKIEMRLIHV